MNGKELRTIAKATATEFAKDDVGYMAAALTYYGFFSLFPMLLLSITLAGVFFRPEDAERFIILNVTQVAPGSVQMLQTTLDEVLKNRNNAGFLAFIGFVTLAFTASGAFDALDKSLNRAWNSEKVPSLIAGKITSFFMMLAIGALLILSVLISTLLTTTKNLTVSFTGNNEGSQIFWYLANFAGSLCVAFLGILLLYRFVPRCDVVFRDVWRAALGVAVLWEVAKEAFAFFLGTSFANYSAVYGTLGTVIALLTWIYVSSIIILTGAEFASETARVRRLRKKLAGVSESDKHQGRGSPWLPAHTER